jgi:uncharacterized protein (DUF58 family)
MVPPPNSVSARDPWPTGRLNLRVTREGWYWLGASVVLLGTGLFKGINLIILLGCLLLVLWSLNWFAARKRLRGLAGKRSVEGPIFAGTPARVEVAITNPGRASQAGLVLEERASRPEISWPISLLPGGAAEHFHREITFPRRGRVAVGPLLVSTTLPLGLTARSLVLAPSQSITVLPRLGRLHRGRLRRRLTQAGPALGRARLQARRHPTAQADLHGVRAFRSGDSPRWIHWRTTARKGELMVREFEEMPTDNLILILDPTAQVGRDGTDIRPRAAWLKTSPVLEEAVSLAATVCWEWCRQTGDHLVLAVAGPAPVVLFGITGRPLALRLLECLAVVEEQAAADGPALLDRLAAVQLPPAAVLLVSAGPSRLGAVLADGLRRPVVEVDVAEPHSQDFYERADADAP